MTSAVYGHVRPHPSALLELLDTAVAVAEADFGTMQLLDIETGALSIVAQRGLPRWWVDYWSSFERGRGSCGAAIANGTRVIVEDIDKSPVFANTPDLEIQRQAGVRAVQSTPIVSAAGQMLGVLSTHYRKPYRPDARVERVLDLLARHASFILEHARIEHELSRSELRYRTLVEQSSAVTWTCPASGVHVEHQSDWIAFTGQSGRDMSGDGWRRSVHPDDVMQASQRWEAAVQQGVTYRHEHRIRRHDGQWRNMTVFAAPIKDAEGRVLEWFGMNFDVTERKEAEQRLTRSERLLDRALKSANAGSWELCIATEAFVASDRTQVLLGLPKGMQTTREGLMSCLHIEDRPLLDKAMRDAITSGEPFSIKVRIPLGDGAMRWVSLTGECFIDAGQHCVVGLAQDVTERIELEVALKESETRYKSFFGNVALGTAISDAKGLLIDVNKRFCEMTGYAKGELVGKRRFVELSHEDDREKDGAIAAQYFAGEIDDYITEKRYRRKDGSVCWVRVSAAPIRSAGGAIVRSVAVIEDITDRKAAESALRDFKALAETSGQFIGICGLDLKPSFINASGLRLVGLSTFEDAARFSIFEFFHPDDRERFRETIFPSVAEAGRAEAKIRFRHFQTGAPIPVMHTVAALKNERGEITGYATVTLDITELERSQAALSEQERKYRTFVTAISDVVYRASPDWSTMLEVIGNGLMADTTEPVPDWIETYIPQGDQVQVLSSLNKAIERRAPIEFEHRIIRADGSVGWVVSRSAPIVNEAGETVEWLGTAKDVTTLHQSQEQLRESEERLRLALAAGRMAIWDWHIQAGTVLWNDEHFTILGYEPHSITPSYAAWRDRVFEDDRDRVEGEVQAAMTTGKAYSTQYRVYGAQNAVRWIEAHGRVEFYADCRPRRLYGVNFDITERKAAEEHGQLLLKEVNHRAKNLLTVVQSIAQMTSDDETPEMFFPNFSSRIRGLAASHDLLVAAEWHGVSISALVRSQIPHLMGLIDRRIFISGVECDVNASAA